MFKISIRFNTSVFCNSEKYYPVNCLLNCKIYFVFVKIFVVPTYVNGQISSPSVKRFQKVFVNGSCPFFVSITLDELVKTTFQNLFLTESLPDKIKLFKIILVM